MGPDYILEEEQAKIDEYNREEIAKNAAIISLQKNISLERATEEATNLKMMQDEAINSQSQEVIVTDESIEFLTPELEDPSSNGLNEQQIYVLKNKILENGSINYP